MIIYDIDAGDEQAVEAALQKLVTGFAGRAQLPEALADVGEHYRRRGNYQNARQIHQHVVEQFPASSEAIQSQRNAILSSVGLNDEPQIEGGIQTLLTQFAADKDIATVVGYVADRLGDGRDEERLRLYQYIIDRHPEHELIVTAKARMGQIMIRRGDDQGAEEVFQQILTEYKDKGHPRLAEAVHLMADGYLDKSIALEHATAEQMGSAQYAQMVHEQGRPEAVKDYCRRAIEKWQIAINELPFDARYTEQAWYFTGVVYRRHLREPDKALPYYQKVAQTWPEYKYAWSAQTMIGLCYENMIAQGKTSREAAAPHIEQAYKATLEQYPHCPPALAAQTTLKLAQLSYDRGRWDQAAQYFGQFLEKYPQAHQWSQVLLSLASTYEKKDQPLVAADLYRSYLSISDPDDRQVKIARARLEKLQEVER